LANTERLVLFRSPTKLKPALLLRFAQTLRDPQLGLLANLSCPLPLRLLRFLGIVILEVHFEDSRGFVENHEHPEMLYWGELQCGVTMRREAKALGPIRSSAGNPAFGGRRERSPARILHRGNSLALATFYIHFPTPGSPIHAS